MLGVGDLRLFIPYLSVFVSGLCVMVVELVAGRIVARHLGASIYTWTSVIGIILAGIAFGNYLGGRIADRYPPNRALSLLFLVSSALAVSIPLSDRIVADWVILWTLDWPVRVSVHVAAVFLIPSMLIGTVSPIAAKSAVAEAEHTGRALGSIYAWGVIGSIIGTFLTGFYLIPTFGTSTVIWLVVITLALMSLVVGGRAVLAGTWILVLPVLAVLQLAPWAWAESTGRLLRLRGPTSDHVAEVESLYSHIRVLKSERNGVERYHLMLDKMTHNTVVVGDPLDLQDPYIRMFSGLTHLIGEGRDALDTMTIGGGGYAFPQYLHHHWPGGRHDVVEIDPEVTRIAAEHMQARMEGFRNFHEDGRVFVNRLVAERGEAARAVYDFIYIDAFNDYTVPYQLTTREFFGHLRTLLRDDGAFMMNMIDSGESGLLLGSLLNTLEEVFPHVVVFLEGTTFRLGARNTFVILAAPKSHDYARFVEPDPTRFGIHRLTEAELAAIRFRAGGLVLTDEFAPTENLIGPVVRSSSKLLAAGAIVSQGIAKLNDGKLDEAERIFTRALEIDFRSASAHRYLGYIHETREDWEGARAHYRRSLEINSAQIELCLQLADSAEQRGDLDDALFYLRTALRSAPDDVEVRVRLGVLFGRHGRLPEAVRELSLAVETDPEHFGARKSLGRALFLAGDSSRARRELEAANRLRPGDSQVTSLLKQLRPAE